MGGAKAIFDAMKAKVEAFPAAGTGRRSFLSKKPHLLHLYIEGYRGYLALEKLAGYPESANVKGWYDDALNLRVSSFSKDPTYSDGPSEMGLYYNRSLAVARNFMFLTPELGNELSSRLPAGAAQAAIAEYESVAPYWFVGKFDASVGESTLQPLYNGPALLQARATILKQPLKELAKYLDAPVFVRGDLFISKTWPRRLARLRDRDRGAPR